MGGQSQKWPDGSCCSNGVLAILDQQVGLQSYAGPGHWNDPDMLEVGNGGMTDTEYRSHFSLWAMLAAPLIAGNDLRNMRPEIHDILTNKEVIAVDQDALGREGERVAKHGDLEVWAKQLKDGSRAVILLNRGSGEQQITVNWEDLGYPGTQCFGARFVAAQGSGKVHWEILGGGPVTRRGHGDGETLEAQPQRVTGEHGVLVVRGHADFFSSSITLWISSFASVRLFMMIWISMTGLPGQRWLWQ